jgi:hypothetical protein
MGLVIIFGLVTIFAIFGLLRALKNKNFLAIGFAFLSLAVFGFFTVATAIDIFTGGGFVSH